MSGRAHTRVCTTKIAGRVVGHASLVFAKFFSNFMHMDGEANGTRAPATLCAKEVAGILKVAEKTVYSKKKELGGHKESPGGWKFDAEKVRAYAELLASGEATTIGRAIGRPTLQSIAGQAASTIFQALVKGESPVNIVIEHRLSPDVVRKMTDDFHAMQGAIVLYGDQLRTIYRLPVSGATPCATSTDLLTLLRDSIAPPGLCHQCKQRGATFCPACRPKGK